MPNIDTLPTASELVQSLEALREQRDEAIDTRLEEISGVSTAIIEAASEIDVQLADGDFSGIDVSLAEITDAVDHAGEELLNELARLASIEFPNSSANAAQPCDIQHEREPLKRVDIPDPATAEDYPEGSHDQLVEFLLNHVRDCAAHIRRLLGRLSDEAWPHAIGAAERGDMKKLEHTIDECQEICRMTRKTYDLWGIWLSELADISPSHAGVAGTATQVVQQYLDIVRRGHEYP